MRNIKLIAIIAFVFTISSCDDELDLAPISDLTNGNYYQTEAHIDAAVAGMYNGMRDLYTITKPWLVQAASDNVSLTNLGDDDDERWISQFITTTGNGAVLRYWEDAYGAIYRCNNVIDRVSEVDFISDEKKDKIIAEAKFLRALIYFDLVRIFGGVPLMTEVIPIEDTYQKKRATVEEVWSQVKTDLNDAIASLPETDAGGHATKYAAYGILADVHLNLAEFEEAKSNIDKVIQSGKYELFEDFADVYDEANNNGPHSIFAIQFLNQAGQGNPYPTRNAPKNVSEEDWPFAGGDNELMPSAELWNLYTENDVRRDLTMKDSFTDGRQGIVYTNRYWQVKHGISNNPSAVNTWGINQIVMRYAEALLISAEAENQLGNTSVAVDRVNMIRNRAGLDDFESSSQQAIQDEIYLQRRLELAFEDERWFDIQRSGKAAQILADFTAGTAYSYSDTYALFPIPQNEIGKVGTDILAQNPGY